MGRRKITISGNTISGSADDITEALQAATDELQKPYEITAAFIKEGLCNYGYEIKTGPCTGDKIPTRKGSALVHDDMITAFKALNIHLAIIDDAIDTAALDSLDNVTDDHLTAAEPFTITGFKITGADENTGIILIGEKYVTCGSIGLETPKITGSYVFYDELRESVEYARHEVEEYMNGKAAPKYEQPELPFESSSKDDEFTNPI